MKRKTVTIGVALIAVAALMTPASAVSEKTRKACAAQAEQVRPALRAGEKEAFIANCLANATATQGGKY
jgi:hypothetical protein